MSHDYKILSSGIKNSVVIGLTIEFGLCIINNCYKGHKCAANIGIFYLTSSTEIVHAACLMD
jgi:hypothetical protein